MALVVESTSTAVVSNADNVVITKPTGVAVGDLLLLVATGSGSTAPTCTGFTMILSNTLSVRPFIALFYRIADASDVAAANYTVALSGATSSGGAAMLRVSGWATGNPIHLSALASNTQDAGDWTVSSGAISLTRPSQQLLLMAGDFFSDDNYSTFSNYTIVSGDANPTWTELVDSTYDTSSGINKKSFFVAYAVTTNTSTITEYSVLATPGTLGSSDFVASFLAVICSPNSPTPNVSHFAIAPELFSPTVTQVNVSPEVCHLDTAPAVEGLNIKATAPTQWTNETSNPTTWTNETL